MSKICVVGAGYVGLVTAGCFAKLGHDVTCLEIDAERAASIMVGCLPIHEPQLDALWDRYSVQRTLRVTTDEVEALASKDFIFICVGTPATDDGSADLSHVVSAARSIAEHVQSSETPVVAIKSTVPVGTAELVIGILAESWPNGSAPAVVSNPEFLREGRAVADFLEPDRVIIGAIDSIAASKVAGLFASLERPTIFCNPRTAELIKYASNAYLATKVSFINQIAELCEAYDVDVTSLAQAVGLDHRIGGHYLEAGLGWGGSCLPKDLSALIGMAASQNVPSPLLASVMEVNKRQPQVIVEKLRRLLGTLSGRTIAVWGLTFKPDCDDLRDSPSLALAGLLQEEGCRVRAYDPMVSSAPPGRLSAIALFDNPYEAARGSEAIVLATAWAEFRQVDFERLYAIVSRPVFVDGRNCLDPDAVESAGFTYLGVGRAQSSGRAKASKNGLGRSEDLRTIAVPITQNTI